MLPSGMKTFWVYILASRPRGTLYVGITNNLVRRIYEHREGLADGFTKEHGVKSVPYAAKRERLSSAGLAGGGSEVDTQSVQPVL